MRLAHSVAEEEDQCCSDRVLWVQAGAAVTVLWVQAITAVTVCCGYRQ